MTSVRETFGLACPKCGQDDRILVMATEYVRLLPDGTESASDQEWCADSPAVCEHCRHAGPIFAFDIDAEVAP